MSRKFTVELDWDTVDNIVAQELKNNLEGFIESLERVKKLGRGDVFTTDLEQDIVDIEKHIEACKLLIAYHTPFDEL
jgi:3-dehydroquinate synthase class II